ncbi:terminase [Salinisphaera orenii MK-B5]|uniref:Terminase n=1 Tax=Salinisphaera orenii MK-B5 TaxID=856730 RepID=A0A423PIZ0_9GAMM|nr:terminase TerL endonuclease subunit [Salinisphaera orenii]ROO25554.1 terminase [Salinisphaera orenii MK-B5]
MTEAEKAITAIERLPVPQGRLAGDKITLAAYQRRFIEGALADNVTVGVWSIGRGNAKTATAAALAVTHLIGEWGVQPQREVVIAGRTKDQAATAFRFAQTFLENLPDDMVRFGKVQTREHPHFSLKIEADDGPHELRAISADGKSALGGAATLVIADERAAWRPGRGEEIEAALLTSLGKRDGRMLIISTSAPDDANSFSQWCDNPPTACFVQEHRPAPNQDADDFDSLMEANPGAVEGIGARPEWLVQQAQQAMQRGGSALASFRNLHRNERVAAEGRDMLVQVDDWLRCEADELPPREGKVIIGLDLGGAASMTASAFYWPDTKRLEARGWFPSNPDLLARGHRDHVGDRYSQMARDGELRMLGDQTVPIRQWIAETLAHVVDSPIECICADRFKQAEVGEALAAEQANARVIWRGMGWRDGAEDVRRFQRAVADKKIAAEKSLLMRSALSDCVVALDESGNGKLSKARSTGRIDPVAAAVLAVAEGSRRDARPVRRTGGFKWA